MAQYFLGGSFLSGFWSQRVQGNGFLKNKSHFTKVINKLFKDVDLQEEKEKMEDRVVSSSTEGHFLLQI